MTELILIHIKSSQPVRIGDTVTERSGHTATVAGWESKRKMIHVYTERHHIGTPTLIQVFSADVYGCEWIKP